MKEMKTTTIFILLIILILPSSYALSDERVCFDTKDIDSIIFKKDYLLFKNRKNVNYSLTCKGKRHLTFQSPLIIDPQKMGYKICSNDVIKLKEYSCFVDEIMLIEEKKEN